MSAMTSERCSACGCAIRMHFSDGCHRAFGFICNCKRTGDELRTFAAVIAPTTGRNGSRNK